MIASLSSPEPAAASVAITPSNSPGVAPRSSSTISAAPATARAIPTRRSPWSRKSALLAARRCRTAATSPNTIRWSRWSPAPKRLGAASTSSSTTPASCATRPSRRWSPPISNSWSASTCWARPSPPRRAGRRSASRITVAC
ncbi:hypothetical protein WR25_09243 [Diploscapter pachys]|uniref:Uncharacterized protein n=1 Tax=Diploscapter pachys TaxID=2018661 RepID=A0A2A2M4C3_9BILA|nr:hypothetical protein WR25_09243 [Diploscapter pachys]